MDLRERFEAAGDGRAWVVAHRGESSFAPENTLLAGDLAWRAGADAWEIDVQLSRDGVPIVLHDDSLVRTTDVACRFASDPRRARGFRAVDFDWDEIRELDAGAWFLDLAGGARSARDFGTLERLDGEVRREVEAGQIRVPRLAEVLRLTVDRGWTINLELKSVPLRPPGLLERVLAAVDQAGANDRVWLSSFDHDEAAVAARAGTLPVGVLAATPVFRPARYVREWVGAAAYHPSVAAIGGESLAFQAHRSPGLLRGEELRALRDAGIPVFVYTVNDVEAGGLADSLALAGVRGIFTDRATELLARWNAPRRSG